jgi:hypothetical protein
LRRSRPRRGMLFAPRFGLLQRLGLDPRISANSGVRGDPRIKSGEDVVEGLHVNLQSRWS